MPKTKTKKNLYAEFEDATPKTDALEMISTNVKLAKIAQEAIANIEEKLEAKKEELRTLVEKTIPEIMDENDIEKIDAHGLSVTLKKIVRGSMSQRDPARLAKSLAWLRKNGYGEIINVEMALDVAGMTEREALKLAKRLKSEGLSPGLKESVHHSTLNAFLSEKLEEGVSIPKSFNLFEQRIAKFKAVKSRK
jgi:hypothetical protein